MGVNTVCRAAASTVFTPYELDLYIYTISISLQYVYNPVYEYYLYTYICAFRAVKDILIV